MYYLTDGLGAKKGCKQLGKVLAVLFACFCILASFGIGNMSQLNSIAGNMNAAFGVPTIVTGLALMVVTALIVIGGVAQIFFSTAAASKQGEKIEKEEEIRENLEARLDQEQEREALS